jgi:hypothetical protein
MKTAFATIIALFAILSTAAFADDVKRERVKFQAGASEATLKASIKGTTPTSTRSAPRPGSS